MPVWKNDAVPFMKPVHSVSESGTFEYKLRDTLMDKEKFQAFIDWMYREFCSEAILSFLEFVQFRKYVKEEIGKTEWNGVADSGPINFDFELYDGMPKSTIIFNPFRFESIENDPEGSEGVSPFGRTQTFGITQPFGSTQNFGRAQTFPATPHSPQTLGSTSSAGTTPQPLVSVSSVDKVSSDTEEMESDDAHTGNVLTKCKRIAHLLYYKYIDPQHAALEINISGPQRRKYKKLDESDYDEMDLEQFLFLYDEVIKEMMKYLQQSYERFENKVGE